MTGPSRATLFALLVFMGAGWGLTQPLSKIAVSEGYRPFGLIFWQLVIGAGCLGSLMLMQGRRLRWDRPALGIYGVIALTGTLLPNAASYQAAVHLPAGILSICISLVPILAFPIALALGTDRFSWLRLLGLVLGFVAMLLILVPDTSLPEPELFWWVLVALIGPLFYAFEGNYVARWGTAGLDPISVLTGASVFGAVLALPLALATGSFIDPRGPWGAPEAALLASSLIHACVYTMYVWMVGKAGALFTAQVSYLVTLFGVFWAIVILSEQYAATVWLALAVMLVGMALVQPRPPKPLGKAIAARDGAGRHRLGTTDGEGWP